MIEERRKKDRRVSPAVAEFALEERPGLLAQIEELQRKAAMYDLFAEEAQRLGFGGLGEALDAVAAHAREIERLQGAVLAEVHERETQDLRLQCGGMESEIEELREQIKAAQDTIEYQDAVIVQRNNEISRMFAEAEELKKDAGHRE